MNRKVLSCVICFGALLLGIFAEALLAPRTVSLMDAVGGLGYSWGRFGEATLAECLPENAKATLDEVRLEDFRPAPLTREEVEKLQTAMRLGGAEFAAELIVECRRLGSVANDPNLPPPIDPNALND